METPREIPRARWFFCDAAYDPVTDDLIAAVKATGTFTLAQQTFVV